MAWSRFTTNGFVAIPHREAARHGLPAAEDFPDDPEKGVYVLGGFHELHCVVCNNLAPSTHSPGFGRLTI